jgi:hypothetical protein
MTPQEIDEVVRSWRSACRHRSTLWAAIRAHLPEGSMCADERADWIIGTVDCLHVMLASPNRLAVAAIEMAERRKAVTSADLQSDRDALMAGLETVLGPLSEDCTMAWHRACGLFADVIAGLIFNPFRERKPESQAG